MGVSGLLLLLLVRSSTSPLAFSFGFLLRLSPSASYLPSSSPSSGFVLQWGFSLTLIWFRLHHVCDQNRIDAVVVLVFASSLYPVALILFITCVLGVMLTCASGHKKPGGRVPACPACFNGGAGVCCVDRPLPLGHPA